MSDIDRDGWIEGVMQIPSPNCDERPLCCQVSLVVVHSISLPPGVFSGPGVTGLFTAAIDPDGHPYYGQIHQLRVSAHLFIRRDGAVVQYVPLSARAWHAGVSSWEGRERCNDFSIGIELEGGDHTAFSEAQYSKLISLLKKIMQHYRIDRVLGHCDIAPGRKTDPGPFFDWMRLSLLVDGAAEKFDKSS